MFATITAAESPGTVFYQITEDELQSYYENTKNIVLRYLVNELGFEAFELNNMWGSYLDPSTNTMYYCSTDGYPITIDGNEVEAEDAIEEYGIDAISDYIKEGTDAEIHRFFTEYELAPPDLDDVVYSLLGTGYSFVQILEDLNKLDLLDNIL